MKSEEIAAGKYLKKIFGNNVFFEPDGNIPPDFTVNSVNAVEVRRLNQQFFEGDRPVGLEQLSFPLVDALRDVFASYNSKYSGKSYWVSMYYARPQDKNIKQIKSEIHTALDYFLQSDLSLPCSIKVNENIELYIDLSSLADKQVFRIASNGDDDAGGGVTSTYIQNIHYCITDKPEKIRKYKPRYKIWWLCLVDYMELGLDYGDVEKVASSISDLGEFDKVMVINHTGEILLFEIPAK